MRNHSVGRSTRRRAFTLLEVTLVLVILVMIGALAGPMIMQPIASQRLRSGAEMVRAAWVRARSDAMVDGEVVAFRYQPGTGEFNVAAWAGSQVQIESNRSAATSAGADPDRKETLPEEIQFVGAMQRSDARDASVLSEMGVAGGAQSDSAAPVLFYPDGTTSSVELQLVNERGQYVVIAMRGLTGIVTVSSIIDDAEKPR